MNLASVPVNANSIASQMVLLPVPFRPEITVKPSPHGMVRRDRTPRKPSILISRIRICLRKELSQLLQGHFRQQTRDTVGRELTCELRAQTFHGVNGVELDCVLDSHQRQQCTLQIFRCIYIRSCNFSSTPEVLDRKSTRLNSSH